MNQANVEGKQLLARLPLWSVAAVILVLGCGFMFASLSPGSQSSGPMDRVMSAGCNGDLIAAQAAWDRIGADQVARHRAAVKLLHVGATLGHANIVRQALAWGADPDARTPAGCTALMMAAGTEESVAIAQVLLDAGADPTAADSHGATALSNAVLAQDSGLTRLLLERGANQLRR
jgi:hypothetical protein